MATERPGRDDALRKARDATLVDNTAQAVFKHLDRLEDHRKTFGARWVWELLQNARDAAPVGGVSVAISLSDDRLEFRHDGAPFEPAEIAHLIYHGSTKVDGTEDLDHFGSGFLSTHLLSRVVQVRGALADGRDFEFDLDRSGRTIDQLREAMNRSWDEFEGSCSTSAAVDGRSTTYLYRLAPEIVGSAREGLASLRRIGPLVLAFSSEIREITVSENGERWSVVRRNQEQLTDSIDMVRIACRDGDEETLRHLAVAGPSGDVQVVLPLLDGPEGLTVALDEDTPRLFALFPLTTTERLHLPAVVNSKRFKPQEDRDGIVLDGESQRITENKTLLEAASGLALQLLAYAAEAKWLGLERLLGYDARSAPDWVDRAWLDDYLRTLLAETRRLPLLRTSEGTWIRPSEAWIPFDESPQSRETLWDLAAACARGPGLLPARDQTHVWFENLDSWRQLESDEALTEAFTTTHLAGLVDDAVSIEQLESAVLSDQVEAFGWIKRLLEMINESGNTALLDQRRLLPSQTGALKRRSDVRYDKNIAEDLKTIAESFDVNLRDGLLDARAGTTAIIELLPEQTEDDALDDVLAGLATASRDERLALDLVPANVALFLWLARSADHRQRLEGYPVATADESDGRVRVVFLSRDPERAPLAPPMLWRASAVPFGSLFPRRKALHGSVAEADPDAASAAWTAVQDDGFVRLDPLYRTHRRLDKLLMPRPYERDENDAHESEDEANVSDIAFLTEDDVGVIDAARKSQSRAVQLVEYLTSSVVEEDEGAFDEVTLSCECDDEHAAYAAAWLKPLHDRSWIPLDNGRSTHVSAESLATLLVERRDLVDGLASERGGRLLQALGVSPADFQLRAVSDEEHERVALVRSITELARAAGGDVERVEMIVNEIRDHPEILDSIERSKQERAKVQRNQLLGRLIEELLREALTARGLTVRRTGVGSDFEIESDVTDGEQEVFLQVAGDKTSVLVEVKSARSNRVRMTPTQARKAQAERDRFALCVVPLPHDSPTLEIVRDECRFVFDIGRMLDEPLSDYGSLLRATVDARQQQGQIDVEIVEGQVRFAVDQSVWTDGLALDGAVDEFTSRARR
jgi:hypothetical protein